LSFPGRASYKWAGANSAIAQAYSQRVLALPAMHEWIAAAKAEAIAT
jgi:hypothetical protein